jgi:hypothetical protein
VRRCPAPQRVFKNSIPLPQPLRRPRLEPTGRAPRGERRRPKPAAAPDGNSGGRGGVPAKNSVGGCPKQRRGGVPAGPGGVRPRVLFRPPLAPPAGPLATLNTTEGSFEKWGAARGYNLGVPADAGGRSPEDPLQGRASRPPARPTGTARRRPGSAGRARVYPAPDAGGTPFSGGTGREGWLVAGGWWLVKRRRPSFPSDHQPLTTNHPSGRRTRHHRASDRCPTRRPTGHTGRPTGRRPGGNRAPTRSAPAPAPGGRRPRGRQRRRRRRRRPQPAQAGRAPREPARQRPLARRGRRRAATLERGFEAGRRLAVSLAHVWVSSRA